MTINGSKLVDDACTIVHQGIKGAAIMHTERPVSRLQPHRIMGSCKPSKLFVNAVFLILALVFANEVIAAFLRYDEGKLGISTKEMKAKYVKYPSVTICLDLDTKKENNGFKAMAPINKTMRDLDFVRHYNNGYG